MHSATRPTTEPLFFLFFPECWTKKIDYRCCAEDAAAIPLSRSIAGYCWCSDAMTAKKLSLGTEFYSRTDARLMARSTHGEEQREREREREEVLLLSAWLQTTADAISWISPCFYLVEKKTLKPLLERV